MSAVFGMSSLIKIMSVIIVKYNNITEKVGNNCLVDKQYMLMSVCKRPIRVTVVCCERENSYTLTFH